MNRVLALCLVTLLPGAAQDVTLLPSWATPHARAAVAEAEPKEADAWVLLDRTEIAYAGEGEVRIRRLRLTKVLTERGIQEGAFVLSGLGGSASSIRRLKGWNARPGGDLDRLEKDSVVTVDADSQDLLSTRTLTAAVVPRVVKGSLVAFECLQVFKHPMGPVDEVYPLEQHPVRRWELQVAKKDGWFTNLRQVDIRMETRHFEPWITNARTVPGESIQMDDLPPLPRGEVASPHPRNILPRVVIRFLDPEFTQAPVCDSWDSLAKWIRSTYASKAYADRLSASEGKVGLAALESTHLWMLKELTYRQVYLAPERGWIPETAAEVIRKRYGDCKDLTTCFLAQAREAGMASYPALARIVEGRVEPDEPVSPFSFNHVIAAIRLEQSLGLKAEVQTAKGRFLLVDPTSRTTPLGYLGTSHLGGKVLICTEAGGIWVDIPLDAIQKPEVEVRLEGSVDPSGVLTGRLTFREIGDQGLRSARLYGGDSGLRAHLLQNVLDLPPTGKLELLPTSDPFDLEKPFDVAMTFVHPSGLKSVGKEATLVRWGLPGMPVLLQRAGSTRRYPLLVEAVGTVDYQAIIQTPWLLRPELAGLDFVSPLRTASWKADAQMQEGRTTLKLRFRQTRNPFWAGLDQRDEAVTAWKQDRAGIKRVLEDGLVFTRLP